MREQDAECPACGGSGGGPFGRAGSAWDVEGYVCPRCQGVGVVRMETAVAAAPPAARRPLAKGQAKPAPAARKVRRPA
jgi:hypothetical protein